MDDGAGDGARDGGSGEVDDMAAELRVLKVVGQEEVGGIDMETAESNRQLQEDELLAVESIYGDNVSLLDKRTGSPVVQIHVDVDSGEYTVNASVESSNFMSTIPGDSDGLCYTSKVRYLPPFVLTCLLPISYPSHSPPSFTITVQWLGSDKISMLCSMLDLLWAEQPGEEIIYRWVEWLQSSSLFYLGFQDKITLGPYGSRENKDQRAISRSVSPGVDIPYIRSYNYERCREDFLKSLHECCICFSKYAGSEFVTLPCQHFFCLECMNTYADIQSKEVVNKIQCLESKCGGMIPPTLLKRLLGDEKFGCWESLMLQKTLDSMSDVAYCPRCRTVAIEDEDKHAQCSKCYFNFCTLCRDRRHVGSVCIHSEMRLKVLQERQSSSHLPDHQKRLEREIINEILSVKEIMRDAKQCPSCKTAISRTEGCNKMVCQNCGGYFCYRCNKAIDGYSHFRFGRCELFPQEMDDTWELEAQMNNNQAVAQAEALAEMYPGLGQACPNCHQFNAKIGNCNQIICQACWTYYCYLCKKAVKRGIRHFGPKGCKQHTNSSAGNFDL